MLAHYDQVAIKAQKVVRGWLARKQVAVLKEKRRQIAAVRIQAGMTSCVTIISCLSILPKASFYLRAYHCFPILLLFVEGIRCRSRSGCCRTTSHSSHTIFTKHVFKIAFFAFPLKPNSRPSQPKSPSFPKLQHIRLISCKHSAAFRVPITARPL